MRTFNKILGSLSLALALTSYGSAEVGFAASPYYKSGFIATVSSGLSTLMSKTTATYTSTLGPNPTSPSGAVPSNTSMNMKSNAWGSFLGASVGYRYVDPAAGFTVGSFLTFNFPFGGFNKKTNTNLLTIVPTQSTSGGSVISPAGTANISIQSQVKQKWSAQWSVQLGQVFGQWHPYISLGLSVSSFDCRANMLATSAPNAYGAAIAATPCPKKTKTKVGFVPGVGVNYAVNDKLALGLALSYEMYGSIKNNYANTNALNALNNLSAAGTYSGDNLAYSTKNNVFNMIFGVSYAF